MTQRFLRCAAVASWMLTGLCGCWNSTSSAADASAPGAEENHAISMDEGSAESDPDRSPPGNADSTSSAGDTPQGAPGDASVSLPCPVEWPDASQRFPWFAAGQFKRGVCSREFPEFTDAYDVTKAQVRRLESRYPALEHLLYEAQPSLCEHAFVRQYLGLVIDGHEHIYLNAIDADSPLRSDLRSAPVGSCDGLVWNVLFDIEEGRFYAFDSEEARVE